MQSRLTIRLWLCAALLALAGTAPIAVAQEPDSLRRNPQLVRQQLQESGLSPDEIRTRLAGSGFQQTLLDPFLRPGGVDPRTEVSEEQIRALGALGITQMGARDVEPVPVDTGVITRDLPELARAQGLELFGLSVFRSRTTQFQPVLSGPVPPTYRLGPRDVLVLAITGDVEYVHTLLVTREGFVLIPQVGQVYVNNLTMAQLTEVLRQRLEQSYSGIRRGTIRFDVTIARLRTNQVYVIGEVVQPGAYQLASVATVLNALYSAGGLTERANFRRITVQRSDSTVANLDLYDYLLRGSTTKDIVLEQGDVIFVPLHGPRASLSGAVRRPAIYELRPGETLSDLVEMAGGFRADAEFRRIVVHRMLPPLDRGPGPAPRAVMEVPLTVVPDGGSTSGSGRAVVPAMPVEDQDSVIVEPVLPFERSLYVTVAGRVNAPGRYPWTEGMTLRHLVRIARGPRVGADLREAEIARLPDDRSTGVMATTFRVPLDSSYLLERDSLGRYAGAAGTPFPSPGSAPEVPLQPFDQVTIFQQPDFEYQRPVVVTGEVAFPGTYALRRKDDRLSDLVGRAGGLSRAAYPEGAQFYRALGRAGRVNVELTRALARPGNVDDIVLQPGDSLHVPEYNPTVKVEGAVNSPTSVLYREGAGLDYYIGNAGGYARNADKGRVSVRYANGSAQVASRFLLFRSTPKPGPSSVVLVPSRPEGAPLNLLQLLGTLTQIVTSAVALVAIANAATP